MSEYVVRADTTEPADLTGTAFSHLDVRWLVNQERNGAESTGVGQTVYPAGGGTHEAHYHPNAEEVCDHCRIEPVLVGEHNLAQRTFGVFRLSEILDQPVWIVGARL